MLSYVTIFRKRRISVNLYIHVLLIYINSVVSRNCGMRRYSLRSHWA